MMTSMNFLTLPYNCVTISFLPEIWFWGPTHLTFLYDVTLLDLFFFEGFPNMFIHYKSHNQLFTDLGQGNSLKNKLKSLKAVKVLI